MVHDGCWLGEADVSYLNYHVIEELKEAYPQIVLDVVTAHERMHINANRTIVANN